MVHIAHIDIGMTCGDVMSATPQRLGVPRERLLGFSEIGQRIRDRGFPVTHVCRIAEDAS